MKKLANLNGVKALSKMEQKSINGGSIGDCDDECTSDIDCTNSDYSSCQPFNLNISCPDRPKVYKCVQGGEYY